MLHDLESENDYQNYTPKLMIKKSVSKRGRKKIETNRYVIDSEAKIAKWTAKLKQTRDKKLIYSLKHQISATSARLRNRLSL